MEGERGPDQVTEVTNTSWFQRIGQAFAGVLVGFLLIPVSIVVLERGPCHQDRARPRRGRRHRPERFCRKGRSVK